jgi:pimeloyl-ACP methyl ester carboxylesterase
MTMGAFIEDLIALSSDLARRFHKNKILLVGHSWGSVIGMIAASRRPDLFSAYIGIGQMSRMAESELISYKWTLEQAERAKDQSSVKKLTDIGPPPYTGRNWRSKFLTERRILGKHGGEYYRSKSGAFGVVSGILCSRANTPCRPHQLLSRRSTVRQGALPELSRIDLFVQVPEVKIPVYFCLGRHDYEVPSVLSAKYFEALTAPRKQLVWFERSAHLPNTEEKDKFNEFMIKTVLPTLPE